jgi:probable O-glycosylation ligase (exosortase A-associated)
VRDLLVSVIIFGSLPIILFRPDFGIMVWAWIGFMNPHRLAWGATRLFPFAQIVAIVLAAGMLLSGRWRMPPLTRETVFLGLFTLWMQFTTLFAFGTDAWPQWEKVLKIQVMVFVTMMVIRSLSQLRTLVWVIALSIGF